MAHPKNACGVGAGVISALSSHLTFRERVSADVSTEIKVREKTNLKHTAIFFFAFGPQIVENTKAPREKRFLEHQNDENQSHQATTPKTPKRCLFGQRPKGCLWLL